MTTIRPATGDDLERVLALETQAFNIPSNIQETRRKRTKPEQIRVLERDGAIVGTLRTLPFGHFFGGRVVPAAGISAVAVSAEARGARVGSTLMREVLTELRTNGTAISSLYPATVPLYDQMGYGFGGVRTFWRAHLDRLYDDRSLGVEAFDEEAIDELDAAYRSIAVGTNGLVERTPDWWRTRVLREDETTTRYRYLVREEGRVTGWVVYRLTETKDSWRSTVSCRDLFWATPRAASALLSLAALHRSTSEKIEWSGPAVETLGDLTREDVPKTDDQFRWMIRLVDVPAAFEARVYHPLIETEVTIGASDPLFADNAGPWRVRVSGGTAKVAPADEAEARASVQTWASIWSSLLSPRDAVRQGRLQASERALDALTLAFSGPIPWIADFY